MPHPPKNAQILEKYIRWRVATHPGPWSCMLRLWLQRWWQCKHGYNERPSFFRHQL